MEYIAGEAGQEHVESAATVLTLNKGDTSETTADFSYAPTAKLARQLEEACVCSQIALEEMQQLVFRAVHERTLTSAIRSKERELQTTCLELKGFSVPHDIYASIDNLYDAKEKRWSDALHQIQLRLVGVMSLLPSVVGNAAALCIKTTGATALRRPGQQETKQEDIFTEQCPRCFARYRSVSQASIQYRVVLKAEEDRIKREEEERLAEEQRLREEAENEARHPELRNKVLELEEQLAAEQEKVLASMPPPLEMIEISVPEMQRMVHLIDDHRVVKKSLQERVAEVHQLKLDLRSREDVLRQRDSILAQQRELLAQHQLELGRAEKYRKELLKSNDMLSGGGGVVHHHRTPQRHHVASEQGSRKKIKHIASPSSDRHGQSNKKRQAQEDEVDLEADYKKARQEQNHILYHDPRAGTHHRKANAGGHEKDDADDGAQRGTMTSTSVTEGGVGGHGSTRGGGFEADAELPTKKRPAFRPMGAADVSGLVDDDVLGFPEESPQRQSVAAEEPPVSSLSPYTDDMEYPYHGYPNPPYAYQQQQQQANSYATNREHEERHVGKTSERRRDSGAVAVRSLSPGHGGRITVSSRSLRHQRDDWLLDEMYGSPQAPYQTKRGGH